SFLFDLFSLTLTLTTVFYPLSLHDALPIFVPFDLLGQHVEKSLPVLLKQVFFVAKVRVESRASNIRAIDHVLDSDVVKTFFFDEDRKSTRLNSSHGSISYAVFCLKKKNKNI